MRHSQETTVVGQSGSRTSMQSLRPPGTFSQPETRGAKAKAVRSAVLDCPEEFTIYNVEDVLKTRHDRRAVERVSISQVLHDFARSGEIFIKTPSYGRRAAVYCKSRPPSRRNAVDFVYPPRAQLPFR